MRTRSITLAVAITALALSSAGASPARAATAAVRQVHPGPNAIMNAVNASNPGDILSIHPGTYHERVRLNKRLTLRKAEAARPVIDGDCATRYTIEVNVAGVKLNGLQVQGASEGFGAYPAEIDFTGVSTGHVVNTHVIDTCEASGGAEYGVNVYASGAIVVQNVTATGFSDAGIYVGGISSTGTGILYVSGNHTYGNFQGVIVEYSSGGDIRVLSNNIHDNTRGVHITISDGVRVTANTIQNNTNEGIRLANGSDNNRIRNNTVTGNGTDLVNMPGQAGNCFSNNTYATSSGNVGTPCT